MNLMNNKYAFPGNIPFILTLFSVLIPNSHRASKLEYNAKLEFIAKPILFSS